MDPAEVIVEPREAGLALLGQQARFEVVVRDQHGEEMDTVVEWWSMDQAVVGVMGYGVVEAVGRGGEVEVVAEVGGVADTVSVVVDLAQRRVLMEFYEALGGDGWEESGGWGELVPLGEWYGVTVNVEGNVERLELQRNTLEGELPESLVGLEWLERLDLGFNYDIHGEVPAWLGRMERLRSILLHHSDLEGEIPDEWAMLRLDTLNIHDNLLTGELPGWLGGVETLIYLNVWGNEGLVGELPASLGDLPSLGYLSVFRTGVSGPLPRSLIQLDELWSFYWDGTALCSPADDEFQEWLANIRNMRGEGTCGS